MRFLYLVFLLAFQLSTAKEAPTQLTTSAPTFIENRGQLISTDNLPIPDVKFYSGAAGTIQTYFTANRVSYVFPKIEMRLKPFLNNLPKELPRQDSMEAVITQLYRMDVQFVGANPNAQIVGNEQSTEYTNYYLAHCPDGITHVPSFAKLVVRDIYPNIDAIWKTTEGGLKYEFVVHPGGDYRQISMRYVGADVEHYSGQITATTPLGSIRDESPISYQEGKEIQTEFQRTSANYGFSVGKYDTTQTLIIDPMVVWATYQGGVVLASFFTMRGFMGMRVDASGNSIIAGCTYSAGFPTTTGVVQTALRGGYECYIAKFDKDGARKWGTFYGGSDDECVPHAQFLSNNCLALDGNNSIIMVGTTVSTDFPVQNAAQSTKNGASNNAGISDEEMFAVKLYPDGTREWATYYGGSGNDEAWGVTADASGNVIMVGWSVSLDFPTYGSVFQLTHAYTRAGGAVVKFNSSGVRQWATYFSDTTVNSSNYFTAVTSDNSGNSYITGVSFGPNFPVTAGAYHTTPPSEVYSDLGALTVVKLDVNGQRGWATFHASGFGNDIICDNTNLYIVGTTQARFFDVTAGYSTNGYASVKGECDVCIFMLDDNTGNRNANCWSRLFGGTESRLGTWQYGSTDYGQSIAFDSQGDIWVGGLAASSSDFPITTNASIPSWAYTIQQSYKGGGTDGFFARFNRADGYNKYSSLFGSTGNDCTGYAFPYGSSSLFYGINSTDDAAAGSYPVPTNRRIGTPYHVAISKICTTYGVNSDAGSDAILCSGDTVTIGSTPINGNTYSWNTRTDLSDSAIANPKAFPKNTGTTQYKVKYFLQQTDIASGCYGRDTVELTVKPAPALPSPQSQPPQCVGNVVGYSLTGLYTPATGDRFYWDAAGGVVVGNATQQSAAIRWTTVGIDTVYMRVTNTLGCSALARLPVEVTALPVVNAGIDPPEVCEGVGVKLNGAASGGTGTLTYSWTPLNGISSPTALNPIVIPTDTITDYILTVTDSRGCMNFDTVRVRMNPKPIAFAGEDKQICIGESIQLSSSSNRGTPPYTISWTPATGLNSTTVSDPVAKPTVTTDYVFYVTDAKGCKNFDTVRVIVLQKPILTLTPTSLDFGKLDGCTSSLEKIDSIENKGTLPVQLMDALSDDSSFTVSSGLPITIPPGQKAAIKIKYSPIAAKASTGKIIISGSPCGVLLPITVSGEKLSLAVKALPTAVDFGKSITCTNRTADTIITITNTGTDVLTLVQPIIQQPYTIVAQTFPQSLKVGENIRIQIRYAPTSDGNFAQTIGFPFSAGVCKDTIKISMNGVSSSQNLTVSPSTVEYPSLSGCETFRDTTIIIENTTNSDIRVDSSIGGGTFKITSPQLPITLKSGAKQTVKITFAPTTTGLITDSIQFAFSPCNKKSSVQLSGSKQGASFALADTLDAGEIISCLSNASTVKLRIENTSSGGATGAVTTVTAGKSLTTTLTNGTALPNKTPIDFDVTITPPSNGVFVDSLTIVFSPCGITKTVFVKVRRTTLSFKADIANVNFGKIQNGSTRSIPILFTNIGSSALTITTIPPLNTPFLIESIVPPLPARLQPNEKLTITVKYKAETGVQTSKVVAIATIPCAAADTVLIQGEGTLSPQPSLSATKQLTFDSVCIGKEKMLTAQLVNNGAVTLQIQKADISGSTDFALKNFVPRALQSGDKMDVQVACIPSATGQTTARIIWVTDLLQDTTDASGIGKDCGNPLPDSSKTTVKIADIQADVGAKVKLAVVMTKQQGLLESGATKFKATLRMNRNIIHCTDPNIVCISGTNPALCEVEITGNYQSGRDTLGFIDAEATLGDVESAPLELVDFQWTNGKGVVNVVRQNGEFRLLNLCREGGLRLYQSQGTVSITLRPNPASQNAEVEYTLREETFVKIDMTNILGQQVILIDNAIRKQGTYKQTVELANVGEGVYFLNLLCPNITESIRVYILK